MDHVMLPGPGDATTMLTPRVKQTTSSLARAPTRSAMVHWTPRSGAVSARRRAALMPRGSCCDGEGEGVAEREGDVIVMLLHFDGHEACSAENRGDAFGVGQPERARLVLRGRSMGCCMASRPTEPPISSTRSASSVHRVPASVQKARFAGPTSRAVPRCARIGLRAAVSTGPISQEATYRPRIAVVGQTCERLIGLGLADLAAGDPSVEPLAGVPKLNRRDRGGSFGLVLRSTDPGGLLDGHASLGDHPVETGLQVSPVVPTRAGVDHDRQFTRHSVSKQAGWCDSSLRPARGVRRRAD